MPSVSLPCYEIEKWLEIDLGVSQAFRKVIELVLPASLTISLMQNRFLIGCDDGTNKCGLVHNTSHVDVWADRRFCLSVMCWAASFDLLH